MPGPQSQLHTQGKGWGAEPLSLGLCSPPVPQQPGGPHFHTVPASGVISQRFSWSRVVQGPPAVLLSECEYPDVRMHTSILQTWTQAAARQGSALGREGAGRDAGTSQVTTDPEVPSLGPSLDQAGEGACPKLLRS